MNLGKLLGAGKTFFDGGATAEYRLHKRVCLPKFNEGKNPFTPKPPAEEPAAPKTETKAAAPDIARTQQVSAQPAARPARAGWTARLNPFRAPEPVAPPMPNAVQPELSLDAVKVVHNDLADADIEIVPVKSRAAAPMAPPVFPATREAWEGLGESLLKPG